MRTLARLQPWTLFLLRIAVGFAMVYHSHAKVFTTASIHSGHYLAPMQSFNQIVARLGLPPWLGYVSTVTEFFGGLSLLLGIFTRVWAFLIAINMLVALITVNLHRGYPGSELSLALLAMSLMLVTAGSGKLALDRRFS